MAPTAPQLRPPAWQDGYVTPQTKGHHYVGAAFDEPRTDAFIIDEDHQANLRRAARILPDVFDQANLVVRAGWAAVRCASRDRLPVIGAVDTDLFCCIAMGSRGFSWASLAAETLASVISGASVPQGRTVLKRLSATRFLAMSGTRLK